MYRYEHLPSTFHDKIIGSYSMQQTIICFKNFNNS